MQKYTQCPYCLLNGWYLPSPVYLIKGIMFQPANRCRFCHSQQGQRVWYKLINGVPNKVNVVDVELINQAYLDENLPGILAHRHLKEKKK